MIKKEMNYFEKAYFPYSYQTLYLKGTDMEEALKRIDSGLEKLNDYFYLSIDQLDKFCGKHFELKQESLSSVVCDITTEDNIIDMLLNLKKRALGSKKYDQKIKDKLKQIELSDFQKSVIEDISFYVYWGSIDETMMCLTLYTYEFEEKEYIQYANLKESDDIFDMIYDALENENKIINLFYKVRNKLYFNNNKKQMLRKPKDTPIEFGVCKGYRTLENALHVGYGHEMWRSYHSYKNPEALPGCVMTSLVAIFIRSGWVIIVLTWIWYYLFCKSNNKKLAEHPRVQKERNEFIEKQSKKVITQDMVDYCNYYKIPIKYYEDDIK